MKFSDLFSMRLYKEGLSRVKGLGIVAFIWSLLSSLSSPVSLLAMYLVRGVLQVTEPQVIMPGSLISRMIILLLFAPLIVGRSFRFLNKRSTCDFYHALPYKRITVYCSFFLGALTWVAAAAVVPFLLALLLYVVCPFATVMVGPSLLALLAMLACLLFLCGASALAMSMTGTAFSNFAVFCILVFGVPTFMAPFGTALQAVVPIYDISKTALAYLTYSKSLPLLILKSGLSATVSYDVWSVVIYAVVGLAFAVLAALAYIRRPGEMAGTPARPVWQSVWRNCVAAPVLFLGMATLVQVFMPGADVESRISLVIATFACIAGALATVILYELLSAGSLRGIGRLFRHFLWLFAAGAVFIVAVLGFRVGVLFKKLEKSDVVSVNFSERQNSLLFYLETPSYEDLVTKNAFYSDPEIIDLLYDAYTESVEASRRGEFQESGPVHGALVNDYYKPVCVTFRTKRGTFTRVIRISTLKYDTVIDKKKGSDEYGKAAVTLPPSSSIASMTVSDIDRAKEIWKIFCHEYEALSDAEKAAYKNSVREMTGEWIFYFRLIGVYDGAYYENIYPIPASFEKTMDALISATNRKTVKDGTSAPAYIQSVLRDPQSITAEWASVCVASLYDENGTATGDIEVMDLTSKHLTEKEKAAVSAIADSIDPASEKSYTAGTPFLVVRVELDDDYSCVVILDAETYDLLLSHLKHPDASVVDPDI